MTANVAVLADTEKESFWLAKVLCKPKGKHVRVQWFENYAKSSDNEGFTYLLTGLKNTIEVDSILVHHVHLFEDGSNRDGKKKFRLDAASLIQIQSALLDVQVASSRRSEVPFKDVKIALVRAEQVFPHLFDQTQQQEAMIPRVNEYFDDESLEATDVTSSSPRIGHTAHHYKEPVHEVSVETQSLTPPRPKRMRLENLETLDGTAGSITLQSKKSQSIIPLNDSDSWLSRNLPTTDLELLDGSSLEKYLLSSTLLDSSCPENSMIVESSTLSVEVSDNLYDQKSGQIIERGLSFSDCGEPSCPENIQSLDNSALSLDVSGNLHDESWSESIEHRMSASNNSKPSCPENSMILDSSRLSLEVSDNLHDENSSESLEHRMYPSDNSKPSCPENSMVLDRSRLCVEVSDNLHKKSSKNIEHGIDTRKVENVLLKLHWKDLLKLKVPLSVDIEIKALWANVNANRTHLRVQRKLERDGILPNAFEQEAPLAISNASEILKYLLPLLQNQDENDYSSSGSDSDDFSTASDDADPTYDPGTENQVTSSEEEFHLTLSPDGLQSGKEDERPQPEKVARAKKETPKKFIRGVVLQKRSHYCCFCQKLQNNIYRHLLTNHKKEPEVVHMVSLDLKSKERKRECNRLLKSGDHMHNMFVYAHGGDFVLARRPDIPGPVCRDEYGPCLFCFGWFKACALWQHHSHCLERLEDSNSKQRKHHKNLTLAYLRDSMRENTDIVVDKDFRDEVLNIMRADSYLEVIMNDNLILKVGYGLYETQGYQTRNTDRQAMRYLARLLTEMRSLSEKQGLTLMEVVLANDLNLVANAARVIGDYQEDKREYKKSCASLNCATNYKKAVREAYLHCLSKEGKDYQKAHELFLLMGGLQDMLTRKINLAARMDREKRLRNKPKLVPLTSDLIQLHQHLSNTIRDFKDLVSKEERIEGYTWGRFMRAVLCKVHIFNKKRSAEAASVTIQDLFNPPNWDDQTSEEGLELSPWEEQMRKNFALINVPGKRWNKPVPLLLTKEMAENMKLVVKTGKSFVAPNNQFVFAARKGAKTSVRGHDALRDMVDDIRDRLQRPQAITGTNLRKYFATIVQVLNLKDKEIDWVAKFLGHDIMVHRQYYRQTDATVYTTQVAKLLIAADEGKMSRYKGKSLNEVAIDDDYFGEDVKLSDGTAEAENTLEANANTSQTSPSDELEIGDLEPSSAAPSVVPHSCSNVVLSQEEKEKLVQHFEHLITELKTPGKLQCLSAVKEIPSLKGKINDSNWKKIKQFVHARVQKTERNANMVEKRGVGNQKRPSRTKE